ncbi:suppressor of SWI4 1 homolog [Ornithorhynchus anatinus]|uniref:Peter pan homolog n=1 Tax=Ornithorhynchus anatinus TaxID=9258 RepID=F7CSB7_ORNAN|nr:suppressor of SWI4 1 homolog [Ornithorhynchus anatinus]
MGRNGKTQRQKRGRAAALLRAQEAFGSAPHSFVFSRGAVGKTIRQLSLDLRRVMEPYTASALQVRKKNSLKDCVAVAGPLGVTHFLIFTKTENNIHLKLVRLPGGPTLTFRVTEYALIKDVISALRRHRMHEQQFTHHPLLVLNNMGLEGMQVKLMASMFQNMFPSINVHKVSLNTIKRCLLISYNPETQLLDFRHYSLKVVPVGASRGLKKLLQEKFPNMRRLQDISELLVTGANLSDSEAEQDGDHNVMELPQVYSGRGNMKAQQSAVRLTEIGPRMTLQLTKIQEGVCQGNVLYHSFIHKTEEEIQATLALKEQKLQLKAERRNLQESNIRRKEEQREAHKKRSLAGMKRKRQQEEGDSDAEDPGPPTGGQQEATQPEDEEDEAEYFRQAVGEEPDEDLFPGAKYQPSGQRKRQSQGQPATRSQKKVRRAGPPCGPKSKQPHPQSHRHRDPQSSRSRNAAPGVAGPRLWKRGSGPHGRTGKKTPARH